MRRAALALAVCIGCADTSADILGVYWERVDNSIGGSGLPTTNDPQWQPGLKTYRLFALATPGEIIRAVDIGSYEHGDAGGGRPISITKGSLWRHPFNANDPLAPNPLLAALPGFEGLIWTSHLAIDQQTSIYFTEFHWNTGPDNNLIDGQWHQNVHGALMLPSDGPALLMQITATGGAIVGGGDSEIALLLYDHRVVTFAVPAIPAPASVPALVATLIHFGRRRRS